MSEAVGAATPVWQEPVTGTFGHPGLLTRPGLAAARAFVNGDLPPPPIHHLTGLRPTEAGVGVAAFVMPASPWWSNVFGLVPGGALAFLADAPLGMAISTGLPVGKALTTAELSISFVRTARPDGGLLAGRAHTVHTGRSLALSRVEITDAPGRLLAHGSTRCVVLDVPVDPAAPWPDPPPPRDEGHLDIWQRPPRGSVITFDDVSGMSGLELMRAFMAGELPAPPVGHLTGLRPVEAKEGYAAFSMPTTPWLCSPAPWLYGGAIALLAETAVTATAATTVPAGALEGTVDLKVQFLRPVFPDSGHLTARGTIVHRGRSMAIVSVTIVDAADKTVALATGASLRLSEGAGATLVDRG